MSSLLEYFHTDWSALTLHDWLGLIITVVVFLVMIALYAYVLHPANKAKLESQRYLPSEDEEVHTEIGK